MVLKQFRIVKHSAWCTSVFGPILGRAFKNLGELGTGSAFIWRVGAKSDEYSMVLVCLVAKSDEYSMVLACLVAKSDEYSMVLACLAAKSDEY